MMTHIPTEAEILSMDGEPLTRMAWALDLHPFPGSLASYEDDRDAFPGGWAPHQYLDQAELVLRALRHWGYVTSVYGGHDFGRVSAKVSALHTGVAVRIPGIERLWGIGEPGNPAEQSEAMALLRCAVLARAREARLAAPKGDTPWQP